MKIYLTETQLTKPALNKNNTIVRIILTFYALYQPVLSNWIYYYAPVSSILTLISYLNPLSRFNVFIFMQIKYFDHWATLKKLYVSSYTYTLCVRVFCVWHQWSILTEFCNSNRTTQWMSHNLSGYITWQTIFQPIILKSVVIYMDRYQLQCPLSSVAVKA